MDAIQLSHTIGLDQHIISLVQSKAETVRCHGDQIRQLTEPERAEEAYRALAEELGEDDMAMLACQLEAAAQCCDRLLALGVSRDILVDTMKCFPRFLAETKVMTGRDEFDRAWWTWRQTSGRLLRIGVLEYEWIPGGREISLHIPSDARFTPENVDASLAAAKEFVAMYAPQYVQANYVCYSWLLSPKLRELLPESSHILSFQNRFDISHVDPDNRDYIGWLFRVKEDTPAEDLPEDTSLQKNAKKLILSGGNIGEAGGRLYK